MKMKIAIVGLSRVGKDTVGEIIRSRSNELVMNMAFGDALKTELFNIFPTLPKEPKPREEMVLFGQYMRSIQHDIWIEKLEACYKTYQKFGVDNFIITDLRQFNEYVWAKRNGFVIVGVHSDPTLRKERAKGDKVFIDVSETESEIHRIPLDYLITNNGSHEDLEKSVITLLNHMGVEQWKQL
jgi:dephospho-CoA kinase